MAAVPKSRLTPEEYIAQERQADIKSEYVDGVAYAMTGASREHNLIALNVGAELRQQLRGRACETYVVDMRVRVGSRAYFYPDVVVVCSTPQFEDDRGDTLLDPTVVFEVLSPSTEDYDLGTKFALYRTIDSLQEYLLVAQDRCHVTHYARQSDNTWLLSETLSLDDVVVLPSIDCRLALRSVYERVDLLAE